MIVPRIREKIKKVNIKLVIGVFIIVYTISPFVKQAISSYLTTYFYMVIVVAAVVFTFVTCRLKHIRDYIFLLIPFVLFQALELITYDNSNVLLTGYKVLLFMLPVCLGFYILNDSGDKQKSNMKVFSIVIVLTFLITAVTTIIGCINNPNAARLLATTASSQDPTAVSYNWQNIGGFSFVYSCTLMYPLVILGFKQKKLPLVLVIGFTLVEFALAINTEYTISLMLIMFSSLLFLLPRNLSPKKFILISIAAVILIVVFSGLIAMFMDYVGQLIGKEMMGEKMMAVFGGKEVMDNLDDRRMDRYMRSFEAFLSNPLFGCFLSGDAAGKVGGHSFILDVLAKYGLLGATILFFAYRSVYKTFYKPLKKRMGFGFVIWLFVQPIILSALNTGFWLDNLCFFSPVLLIMIFGVEKTNESALDSKYNAGTNQLKNISKAGQRALDERTS